MGNAACSATTMAMVLYSDQIGLFPHVIQHGHDNGYSDPSVVLIGESWLDRLPLPVGACPESIRRDAFADQDRDGCPRFLPFVLPFDDLVEWAKATGDESHATRLKNYPGIPVYVINDDGGTFLSFTPSPRR